MKKILPLLISCCSFVLNAQEWTLKSANFTFEDDLFYQTDRFYTYGSRLLFLYEREKDSYISFAFTNKMYTPEDLDAKYIIEDDVPYAGYLNLEAALYERDDTTLSTYIFQLGFVGPATHIDRLQVYMHKLTDSDLPQGWDNQLNNELTFQFNYDKKYAFEIQKKFFGFSSILLPQYGFQLGNVSTKAYAGAMYRLGSQEVMQNFGASSIGTSSYGQIPLTSKQRYKKELHLCADLGFQANAIARNIFLDGNTNTTSHSVEKKNYTLNVLYGVSLTYDHFSIDWIHTFTTKQYETEPKPHIYTSFQVLYHY